MLNTAVALECEMCSYRCESTEPFKAPSAADLETALREGERWDGEIFMAADGGLDPNLRQQLDGMAQGKFVKKATHGRYLFDLFEARHG